MKVKILDSIGIHSGTRYYMDAFIDIIHEICDCDVEVLSNYSNTGKQPYLPYFYKGGSILKFLKLLYAGIKVFCTTLTMRNNVLYIITSYGTNIDSFLLFCSFPAKHRIVDAHEVIQQGAESNKLYNRIYKFLYKHIKTVIIHSPRAKEVLNCIGYQGAIMTVPHFEYNLDAIYSEKALGDDVIKCIKTTKINILLFGSISYNKGVDLLVNSVNTLPDNVKERLNIIIAGKSTDETLGGLSLEDGLYSTVIRHINDDEMKFLYSQTDYVILPYRLTYQSGVLEMAINYSKPVIVSDIPYFHSVITKYPSFGLLTGLEVNSIHNTLIDLINKQTDDFYNQADVYSYHHKPEITDFINSLRDFFYTCGEIK